ncbi:amidase [Streptosporangium sp. NPDC051022]|uniref:amidase n=1 Tax=Streptosporangium sp. NPDC051022 TaxID=3155752 RepID=UPI00342A1611
MTELAALSLARVGELIRDREVSPVEVTTGVLERIDRLDGVVGAFVTVLADRALRAARTAEREIAAGAYRGPLHGVPVSLKDLISTRGIRSTAGSASMADRVPDHDAVVVERLDDAGAVVVGKAQTYEFAMGPGTVYPFGRTRNPWDLDRVTIGSSSGSAAGVCALMSYASIGTDTGGSIRGPASGCGVVGFKPTYGRVSRYGVLPLSWTLDHVGPLTRDVLDAALVTRAIEGPDPRDRGTAPMAPLDVAAIAAADLTGRRVGVPDAFFFDGVDPEFHAAFTVVVEQFTAAGATVVPITMPPLEGPLAAHSAIVLGESYSIHEEHVRAHRDTVGPGVRDRMALAASVTARDYLRAQRVRAVFAERFHHALAGVDVIATLTSPTVPHLFDQFAPEAHGPQRKLAAHNRFTRLPNLLGAPAISLPCGFTGAGLPIGLQLVGRPHRDQAVLEIANAYQHITDWHLKSPAGVLP